MPAKSATPARIARRERRRERSREEIVEATRAVILREGLGGTTLEAVAAELGLTKAAIYYYYPSKDALLFDIVFDALQLQSQAVHDGVERAESGGQALRAIIEQTVGTFAGRLDDFRLAFLHGQVAPKGTVRLQATQLAKLRPLNELLFAGATKRIGKRSRAKVEPRIMAFVAYLAALGLLTMKGNVESFDDPLLYSDEQLVEALARIFEAAAAP